MIIDKQAFFRIGVRQTLSEQPDFRTVDYSPNENLFELLESDCPDVILLDSDYPSLSGLKLGRSIVRRHPTSCLTILPSAGLFSVSSLVSYQVVFFPTPTP